MTYYKCPKCNKKHKLNQVPYIGVEYKCQCGFYTKSAFESRVIKELVSHSNGVANNVINPTTK
jgi:hypothetical protein